MFASFLGRAAQLLSHHTMARLPSILHHLEFDYYDERKLPMCESLSLLAVGHRNVLSLCHFSTRYGKQSGWHGSWSAEEHDDTGLPTRLTLFFSWKGTEAIQYRQVMQYIDHNTWTNTSGQPTSIFLKSRSMITMLLVSIMDECTWEGYQVRDSIQATTLDTGSEPALSSQIHNERQYVTSGGVLL